MSRIILFKTFIDNFWLKDKNRKREKEKKKEILIVKKVNKIKNGAFNNDFFPTIIQRGKERKRLGRKGKRKYFY